MYDPLTGSHRIAPNLCPNCGKLLDAATCISEFGIKPKEGDFTICTGCFIPLCFEANSTLRRLTPADEAAKPDSLDDDIKKLKLAKLFCNAPVRRDYEN